MSKYVVVITTCTLFFLIAIILSLMIGQTPVTLHQVLQAFVHYDADNDIHVLIRTTRLSRTIIAALVGASLSVAGLLMQVLMKNPIASPGLFGVNSGAVFMIVMTMVLFRVKSLESLVVIGIIGAFISVVIVMLIGLFKQARFSPQRIILTGAAVAALFSAFTQGLLLVNENNLQSILFWLSGSVGLRNFFEMSWIGPILLITLCIVWLCHRSIQLFTVGDEMAVSLGVNMRFVKILLVVATSILAGTSVSVAGNIMFIGLIVPNIVLLLLPYRFSITIPMTAVLGSTLLLASDIAARTLLMPREIPVGLISSVIGAVMLIIMMKRGINHVQK